MTAATRTLDFDRIGLQQLFKTLFEGKKGTFSARMPLLLKWSKNLHSEKRKSESSSLDLATAEFAKSQLFRQLC